MAACEGCGGPGATTELWYPSFWGSRPVALHESRSCALEARGRLGGRTFLSSAEARLLTAAREYAGWWRRWHASERAEAT